MKGEYFKKINGPKDEDDNYIFCCRVYGRGLFLGSGVLVGTSTILTAWHVLDFSNDYSIKFISYVSGRESEYEATWDVNSSNKDLDIAVLTLTKDASSFKPMKLGKGLVKKGIKGTIIGFGCTYDSNGNETSQSVRRYLEVSITDVGNLDVECSIRTETVTGFASLCDNDSGGALIIPHAGDQYLVGINIKNTNISEQNKLHIAAHSSIESINI